MYSITLNTLLCLPLLLLPRTMMRGTFTLQIRFVSGLVYEYNNVPESIFNAMKATTSKGTFLNTMIKGKHDLRKLTLNRN